MGEEGDKWTKEGSEKVETKDVSLLQLKIGKTHARDRTLSERA